MKLFDLNWKFSYGSIVDATAVEFNDQDWRRIDLPHDWSKDAELNRFSESVSPEIGWYRKNFRIPEDWLDKSIQIDFEGICAHYELFVNGKSVDVSGNKNSSLHAILDPYLNKRGNNIIAIRVVIPKKTDSVTSAKSGIYNHVWLIIKDTSDLSN